MSLRLKIAGSMFLVFIALTISVVFITQLILLSSFTHLERAAVEENLTRVRSLLHDESERLSVTLIDWAYWDDTYRAVTEGSTDFAALYLIDGELNLRHINLVALSNRDGDLLYTYGAAPPAGSALQTYVRAAADAWRDTPIDTAEIHGLHRFGDHLYLISTRPVRDSARTLPMGGTLTFGIAVDEAFTAALAERFLIGMEVFLFGEPNLPADVEAVRAELAGETLQTERELDANTHFGYLRLDDLAGQTVGVLRIYYDRIIARQGQETITALALVLILGGLALSIVVWLLLDRLIARRAKVLVEGLRAAQRDPSLSTRLPPLGGSQQDELTFIALAVNEFLETRAESRRQIEQQHRALEAALLKANESNRLKTEFLSNMSHELRTPLNSILGYAHIMLDGMAGTLDQEAQRMVSIIASNGDHLLGLITTLLDLSKIEAGYLDIAADPLDLRALFTRLEGQMAVLKGQKALTLTFHTDRLPDLVYGDERHIAQIIINLLSNAIKFTDEGSVTLLADWTEDGLLVEVTDTGVGIPQAALGYIFDEFRQVDGSTKRRYDGTGLGLAIARKLARAMGGDITAESKLNAGSTFRVRLPLRRAASDDAYKLDINTRSGTIPS